MEPNLETYILSEHRVEKMTLIELEHLVTDVLRTFEKAFLCDAGTWPYELKSGCSPESPQRLSQSTAAMISFSLGLATGRVKESSLAPSVAEPLVPTNDDGKRLEWLIDRSMNAVIEASAALRRDIRQRVKGSALPKPSPWPPLTESATFGWDDPFTATWLIEVLHKDQDPARAAFGHKLRRRAGALIRRVASDPVKQVLQIWPNECVPHSFPVLRVLQLAKTLARIRRVEMSVIADFGTARDYLRDRINLQLSESHIADGGFDAADLVFALEGWMLASPVDPDLAIVDEVFRVIAENQEPNPYWRPLRPFKVTAQGLVLLPQSVEIANSLLRVCNHDALQARNYFSAHLHLLERYARWLQGRVYRGVSADRSFTFTGWESEHTYTEDRIHLWQTSQVLIFLQHYTAMLRRHIAQKLLQLAPLVPDPKVSAPVAVAPTAVTTWSDWMRGEPFTLASSLSSYRVYKRIESDFITPRVSPEGITPGISMLLYGPPGTGKTTIARNLAKALGFPLLTVTPSDFLTSGGEAVEARAKAIFEVLGEQRNMVVLFDEIDHLLLDRDSTYYHGQGDVFKLLTPGMLSKLNNLAEARSVIFVVATNYYERIDRAIKRPGRIDARYLVLPPDRSQRRRILSKHFPTLARAELDRFACATVRFTYRELSVLKDQAESLQQKAPALALSDALDRAIRDTPPIITIDSYAARLGVQGDADSSRQDHVDTAEQPCVLKAPTVELPLEEVAMLALLDVEANGWPQHPPWLACVVKEALSNRAISDREVAIKLCEALRRAKGRDFIADISAPA